jgi:hypothetical protein
MFTVTSRPLDEIRSELQEYADQLSGVWSRWATLKSKVGSGPRPSVQLSTHEISDEDEEEIFGYAGIPKAAAPIGLPLDIDVIKLGVDPRKQRLLFPLNGFLDHVRQVAPTAVDEYERIGSLASFLEQRGKALSGKEYLAAGLADVIRFAKANNEALIIRW